jgi:translation initiation factor IF-2
MRGRSILRVSQLWVCGMIANANELQEPPGSSICAFCSHRLGTARHPSQVQHRFLQSSRPASRPPATAAALREDDDGSNVQYLQSNSQPSGSPLGGFGRRPAFGGANPPTSSSSGGWGKPAFGSGRIELTEEERQARDLINENAERQQRRIVDVYPQPGPESNRAGRPIPIPKAVNIGVGQKERGMEPAQRRREAPQNRFRIRRHVVDSSVYEKPQSKESHSEISPDNDHLNDQVGSWGQLRRRGTSQKSQSGPSSDDQFIKGRAQRDEKSRFARYTPLIRRNYDHTGRDSELRLAEILRERNSFSRPPVKGQDFETRSKETRDDSSTPTLNPSAENPPQRRFTVTRTMSQADNSHIDGPPVRRVQWKPPGFDENPVNEAVPTVLNADIENVEMEREREDRRRRRAAKFAEEDAGRPEVSEDSARSRKKDKTRRRQQFVEAYEDEQESAAAKAELKRERKREKAAKKAAMPTPILLPEYISVANLAAALKVRVEDFIEKMEELGFEETGYDYILNGENAGLIAMEYNFEPIIDREMSEDLKARPATEDPTSLPSRPPVVTIMGHVDHGKTTLLDWLRKSSVAATEHGGITQHIGAFSVPMPSGKMITFLDTPGHAAFLSMRQRGANVTDIVILVVAADDSVKPQTIEAINHAKAAKVPIIVAINKVDKEEANIDRVKQDLARHGIEIEDFGGDTQVVCVSGKTGQGMEELEDAVVTLSEILDMRAEQDGQAEGWVLEASIKSMGKVATVLVRRGTMRPGDFIVAGKTWARIRCLRNEAGVEITEAGPGIPVEIDGWKEQPEAGDEVLQAPTESKAKSVIEYRLEREERDKMAEDMKAINEARKLEQEKREREKLEAEATAAGVEADASAADTATKDTRGPKQIHFIVKGDVSGSVEAVVDSIASIGNAEVQSHVLRSGFGQLSEFDVEHAAAAGGCLINFNTPIDPNIARQAHAAKVKIIDHNIIYRLVDEVKATLSEHLPPLVTQRVLGEADVAQVFEITVKGRQQKSIAGCKVKNGTVSKNAKVRVLRDGKKIFDGKCSLFQPSTRIYSV